MAVSKKLLREYDRFGPWIIEIHSEDDIPEQFMPQFELSDDTVLAFKVPHPVERRKVRPGDPMYDHLLELKRDELRVFHRAADDVTTQSVEYEHIVGISTISDLLQGQLSILHDKGRLSVPFNTVSQDTIDRTVRYLRERCGGATTSERNDREASHAPSSVVVDSMAPLYRNLYQQEYRSTAVEAVAYQSDITLERNAASFFRRIVDVVWRPRLRPAMMLLSDNELILYRGSPQIVFRGRGFYGYERIVFPPGTIRSVTTKDHDVFREVVNLVISVAGHAVEVAFASDYPREHLMTRLGRVAGTPS